MTGQPFFADLLDPPGGPPVTVDLSFAAVGDHDLFAGPDGPLHAGWNDAADRWPGQYDPAVVRSGCMSVNGVTVNTANAKPFIIVGHCTIWKQLGAVDDVEVGVQWSCPERLSTLHQVSPLAFYDPDASDEYHRGLLPIWDISLQAVGIQNDPPTPSIATVFDTSYYRVLCTDGVMRAPVAPNLAQVLASIAHLDVPTYGAGVTHDMVLRCEDGTVSLWFDGTLMVGPYDVPSEYQGRDGWGVHIISIHYLPGADVSSEPLDPPVASVDHVVPALVDRWWATPL